MQVRLQLGQLLQFSSCAELLNRIDRVLASHHPLGCTARHQLCVELVTAEVQLAVQNAAMFASPG
jgi:hypothetical protein